MGNFTRDFYMWNFTCGISHVKFHMWNFTCALPSVGKVSGQLLAVTSLLRGFDSRLLVIGLLQFCFRTPYLELTSAQDQTIAWQSHAFQKKNWKHIYFSSSERFCGYISNEGPYKFSILLLLLLHMWNFTCEISQMKRMWNVTCEILYVGNHMWYFHLWTVFYDLVVQFYMPIISCENWHVKFPMCILGSEISYGLHVAFHIWNFKCDISQVTNHMWKVTY